ncbi:MAG: hypothetical protein NZ519_05700 [Bacteroidia bacterium]|nr:hypothetical protein [Bacteroidia bacterium]
MRRVGVSPVRSAAKHRSVSVARSTPTLPTQAQAKCGQGHAQKIKLKLSHSPKTDLYTNELYHLQGSCKSNFMYFCKYEKS